LTCLLFDSPLAMANSPKGSVAGAVSSSLVSSHLLYLLLYLLLSLLPLKQRREIERTILLNARRGQFVCISSIFLNGPAR